MEIAELGFYKKKNRFEGKLAFVFDAEQLCFHVLLLALLVLVLTLMCTVLIASGYFVPTKYCTRYLECGSYLYKMT
jgi:Trk-type K+ transport system membrane component